MNLENSTFLKILIILILSKVVKNQTVMCFYERNFFIKLTNEALYSCSLNSRYDYFDEKLSTIQIQHETGYNDADVKYLENSVATN